LLSQKYYDFLVESIENRKNILIVGGTGSGKTTFINAIIKKITEIHSEHRIIIIEDTGEIQCEAKNRVILRANKTTTMLTLLKATMRLRPDRILVGEVRGKEALDLLKAWNTGHPGGCATLHADSAYEGLLRMKELIAEGSTGDMQELIARAVNIVVFMEKTPSGREIKEIIEVQDFNYETKKYVVKTI